MNETQSLAIQTDKVLSSSQSMKIKRQEMIAKGIIWFLAGLTIAVLAWIIAYLMVRGFRYDNHVPYDVSTEVEYEIPVEGSSDGLVFIINSRVRSEDLTVAGLRKLYNKSRRENWGFYNQQNLKVQPFSYEDGGVLSRGAEKFLLVNSDLKELRKKTVQRVGSWDEMVEKVASTRGALGFIPSSMTDQLPGKVKVLGVRRMSVVVNDSVMMIRDGRMMRDLRAGQKADLFAGKVGNWQGVGGIDLPVTLVHWDSGGLCGTIAAGSESIARVVEADSADEFLRLIRETEGAVGLSYYSAIEADGMSFLPVKRHETGWNINWHFLFEAPARSGQWGGISYIIINTFFLILFTVLFSAPVGVMAAVYMVEYARQGRLMRILRMGTETLSGIPSIVFGLFGFLFFVQILGLGIGFISSTLTITLMVLPTIIRTSEEALKSVPRSFREGSLALGATKLQTIAKVVLPAASPGILTGIILAIGRTVGETAVLIYTLGSNYDLVSGPSSSARVLSLHLYMLFSEALSFDRTFATAAILVIIVLITNLSATHLVKRVNKNRGQ